MIPMNTLLTSHQPPLTIPRLWSGFTLIALALACFALCQQVQSATDTPDPGGSLPVSNTADGQLALGSLTTGILQFSLWYIFTLKRHGRQILHRCRRCNAPCQHCR